jgi:hypothetical protein
LHKLVKEKIWSEEEGRYVGGSRMNEDTERKRMEGLEESGMKKKRRGGNKNKVVRG